MGEQKKNKEYTNCGRKKNQGERIEGKNEAANIYIFSLKPTS